ncbi:glycosyltransferase family 2 protein [Aliivibrio fischeri]|uniref:glycosyltransferase family 2 protein n=1 Tax=Aliivibrio fischeri TaxID=668 RepID=UPI00080DF750|nr:glycosyltransferase family 2 protein [Aliivibrio fischeri]OCH05718.1 hypothetical protein A6E11_01735 [Aliivibrio fischeri]
MKIDVIIPYYNKSVYIKRAIDSIDFSKINKVYIIDDLSIEPIGEINNNVEIIRNENNRGPSYSRNIGAKLSDANYLLFLDADDYFDMKLFDILNDILSVKNVPFISWKIEKVINSRFEIEAKRNPNIYEKECYFYHVEKSKNNLVMSASSFCVRRDVFFEIGGFNESLRVQEDPEFFCRISKEYQTIYIDEVFSYYDISDEDSLSKINFKSITFPYYISSLKEDGSDYAMLLYRSEYLRYYFLSLLNKSNRNYKTFLKSENISHISFIKRLIVFSSSIIPSFFYVRLYKLFRYFKYER